MVDSSIADKLDVHPASPAEREASFHNTHDVWSRGLPLAEHVAHRLQSPLHGRAAWYVGTIDGRVVTSLAVHPLEFQLRGRTLRGFGIGSVHTLASHRRQGLAPRLLAWVEAYRREQGDQASLLFSDIDPDFYARLGYQLAPAWHGFRDLETTTSADDDALASAEGAADRLAAFDGRRELDAMAASYAQYHRLRPLSIERNAEYWAHLFLRQSDDAYHWFQNGAGEHLGYVRLKRKGDDLLIEDYALGLGSVRDGREETLASRLYAAAVRHAREAGPRRVGGWLPDLQAARRWFAFGPRTEEIPMFKPLDPSVVFDAEALALTDTFCELDHV